MDINSGDLIAFVDKDIEKLQIEHAKKLGSKLIHYKLKLLDAK